MDFVVISEKKKVFTQIWSFFLPKTRWRPKKKGLHSGFDRFFLPKSKWTHTQKKGHSDGFCGILLKASTKEIQGLVSATHNVSAEVSIKQSMQKPLARATLKPLAATGRALDAPALIDGFRSSVYQKLAFCLLWLLCLHSFYKVIRWTFV